MPRPFPTELSRGTAWRSHRGALYPSTPPLRLPAINKPPLTTALTDFAIERPLRVQTTSARAGGWMDGHTTVLSIHTSIIVVAFETLMFTGFFNTVFRPSTTRTAATALIPITVTVQKAQQYITCHLATASLATAATTTTTMSSEPKYFTGANGCFWGPHHMYKKHFSGKGLLDSKVGYIGGTTSNPTYESVCSGKTGHAEAIQIKFDPSKVSYAELVEFLLRTHDPTQKDKQGADVGTQYRSAIFPHNAEQADIARKVITETQEKVSCHLFLSICW